jgi:6-phosphogluconolactonase
MKRAMKLLLGWALISVLAALCNNSVWAQDPAAQPQFVYANDDIAGTNLNAIEGFSVNAATGALTPLPGSPFSTGGSGLGGGFVASPKIISLVLGRAENFLYVSNGGSNNISVFKINPRTGIPTLMGSPVATGGSAGNSGIGMAASPNGLFLFAGNSGSNSISAFSINSKGELKAVAGSPFSTTDNPDGVLVMPNDQFLLAAQPASQTIAVFSIGTSGCLMPVAGSPFPAAGAASGLDTDASGTNIFVGDAGISDSVEVYNQSLSGALTAVTGSPFIFTTFGMNSNVVLLSPNGNFLFVSNQFSTTVTKLAVDQATGTLSGVTGDPFPDGNSGDEPAGMSINPTGTLLFTSDFNPGASHINVLTVTENPDGTETLTPVPGSPFPTDGSMQTSLIAFPGKKPIDPASLRSPSPPAGKRPIAGSTATSANRPAQVPQRQP